MAENTAMYPHYTMPHDATDKLPKPTINEFLLLLLPSKLKTNAVFVREYVFNGWELDGLQI